MRTTNYLPILLASVLAFTLGSVLWTAKPAQAGSPPPPSTGRFQICGENGNVYVLDTTTGQVWQDLAISGYHQGGNDGAFYRPKLEVAH